MTRTRETRKGMWTYLYYHAEEVRLGLEHLYLDVRVIRDPSNSKLDIVDYESFRSKS